MPGTLAGLDGAPTLALRQHFSQRYTMRREVHLKFEVSQLMLLTIMPGLLPPVHHIPPVTPTAMSRSTSMHWLLSWSLRVTQRTLSQILVSLTYFTAFENISDKQRSPKWSAAYFSERLGRLVQRYQYRIWRPPNYKHRKLSRRCFCLGQARWRVRWYI